jgi:hypothetical protein
MPIARINERGATFVEVDFDAVDESRISRESQANGGARDGPMADVLLCMPAPRCNSWITSCPPR